MALVALQMALGSSSQAAAPGRLAAPLELVWDPLTEALEAPPCPTCGRPTYAFDLTRQGHLICPACQDQATDMPTRKGAR
jgi:hypothetical protein